MTETVHIYRITFVHLCVDNSKAVFMRLLKDISIHNCRRPDKRQTDKIRDAKREMQKALKYHG